MANLEPTKASKKETNGNKASGSLDSLPAAQGTSAVARVPAAQVLTDTESVIEQRRQIDAQDESQGFQRFNPLDGLRIFFQVVQGATLRGIVLGRYEKDGAYKTNTDGETNYWYQVQLTAPYADCVVGKGSEKEEYAAQIGDVVIVDERSAMRCIAPVLQRARDEGKKVELLLRTMGKSTTARGRRVWNFDIKGRIISAQEKLNSLPLGLGANPGDKALRID